MSTEHADPRNALPEDRAHDPQETEAVRETVAEWMEAQARRVASGAYLADLEDGTGGRNPVLDLCFLALQAAGMAYTFAEAYRDEERTDAASELEEEVGAAVRAVLAPELHDDVFSDAFDAVGDRVVGMEDDPANGGGNDSTTDEDADTLELPRRLVEELVQAGNLLAHALPDLTGLEGPSFVALEVARQLTREYASRVDAVVVKLEKALGVEDTDKLFEGVRETYAAAARAKRAELAEELGGAS